MDDARQDRVTAGFRKLLATHGHGFQQAVAERIREVQAELGLVWHLASTEVPVTTRGRAQHVDLVLRHRDTPSYLLLECKRAHPSHSDWAFFREAQRRHFSGHLDVLATSVHKTLSPGSISVSSHAVTADEEPYHYWLELKSEYGKPAGPADRTPGDRAQPRDVQNAVAQVARGVSGLANLLREDPSQLPAECTCFILGTIITSARLWTCETDLAASRLEDGSPPESLELRPASMVRLTYNITPDLNADGQGILSGKGRLDLAIHRTLRRTIVFVTPEGIKDYLLWAGVWADGVARFPGR